ncbi:MAG TPA: NfeD family protein [Saprospiraceae bacterium]|nr:NfeD family protein [Saprospiraceae bacterium]
MLELLTYISIISGVLLTIMLLLSIFTGLESDFEIDGVDSDFGLIKSILSFLSIGGLVGRLMLSDGWSIIEALAAAVVSGFVAVFLLSILFRALLKNQVNVNWSMDDAVGKTGKVYLRIPPKGSGLVLISIKGGDRELIAYSNLEVEIPTGSEILVVAAEESHVIVKPMKD